VDDHHNLDEPHFAWLIPSISPKMATIWLSPVDIDREDSTNWLAKSMFVVRSKMQSKQVVLVTPIYSQVPEG
jgi:hypothetical protein